VAPFRDHFRLQEACADLEIKHGLIVDNHTTQRDAVQDRRNGRAADAATREGAPSFLAWVRQEAAPALLAARDAGQGWQGLHQVAADHGLVVKLRGAGLVIGHAKDGRLHIKASDVDRRLSLKSLTDTLGAFEPAGLAAGAQQAGASYTRGALYEAYKLEREAATQAKAAATLALREEQRAYAVELATYYRTRMKAEQATGLRGHLRRDSFKHIVDKRRQDHVMRLAREAQERRQLREAHPVPQWQTWLQAEAAGGNVEAAAALRARQPQITKPDAQRTRMPDRPATPKRERDIERDLEQ